MSTVELGARWNPRAGGVEDNVISAFGQMATTDIADLMRHANVMDGRIKPLYTPMDRFSGTAITVNIPSGSQEVRLAAIETMETGDVLVIAARSIRAFAVLGGKLATKVRARGGVGVVIDGCARDAEEIQDLSLPVLCRGTCAAAGPRTGPGEVNVAVACGGAVVMPGDVVVGDSDGVVVVPRDSASEMLRRSGLISEAG